jgi:CBS domain-containing protein
MRNTRDLAATIAHGPLLTISPAATLREAAHTLYSSSVGALGVEDEHGLVGVLTERDVIDALALGADVDVAIVQQHLSTPVMSARPEDTVLDVALQMLDAGTRHLPVVDNLARPQGMVSLRDLLRPLLLQAMTPPEVEVGGAGS